MPTLGADQTGNADTVLQNIASQTLAAAPVVTPGGVTAAQQAQLKNLSTESNSAMAQYYSSIGLSVASRDPSALVGSGILATQAAWSQMDTTSALNALNLSSQDYNAYIQDQLKSSETTQKELMVAVSIAATIFTFGAASPITLGAIAGGAGELGSSDSATQQQQPGEEIA